MPTPFEIAAAASSAAVDLVYGEEFDFIATAGGADVDARRGSDPARPPFTAKGAWLEPSRSVLPRARGSIQDDNAQKLAVSSPRVSVDVGGMPWRPTIGDRVKRRKTGETFDIAKPLPDGVSRIVFGLTARRR